MHIADVSQIDLEKRKQDYRTLAGAYEQPPNGSLRLALCEIADQQARDELMNEIHAMLCHLCGISEES